MNLSDLSRLDIKDLQKIDYKKLLIELRSQPDIVASLLAILFTIGFGFFIFSQTQTQIAAMRTQNRELEEKVKMIEAYRNTQEELTNFLKNIPPHITEPELVGLITDYANSRNVRIDMLTPKKGEASTYFNSIAASVSITATDYKDAWLFIYDLEHSKYGIRIDGWNASPDANSIDQKGQMAANDEDGSPILKIHLTLSAINLQTGP